MHKLTSLLLLPILLTAPMACATARESERGSEDRYVRAAPTADSTPSQPAPRAPTAPPVTTAPDPSQFRLSPSSNGARAQAKREAQRPIDVVEAANKRASQRPDEEGYANAVMTYDYQSGALYQVYAATLRLTAIQLQPGEKLTSKPALGDIERWQTVVTYSTEDGTQVQHVLIKPTRPELTTTMALFTNRRTYLLELSSYKDVGMVGVRWRYGNDEASQMESAMLEAGIGANSGTNVNLERANYAYSIQILNPSKGGSGMPEWTPVQVFDDGSKTFIRFPEAMLHREAPVLHILSGAKDPQLVNYRAKGTTWVVDRLFKAAELRIGDKREDIVRIVRK